MKVLIGGMFDVIHSGHIFALILAKSFGKYLIVNITPDNRTREKKGKNRPLLSQEERKYIVKHLKMVDEVTCIPVDKGSFEADYQKKFISAIKPDIFIRKDYDRGIDEFCQKNGIKFIILPELKGIDRKHSTDIISKL